MRPSPIRVSLLAAVLVLALPLPAAVAATCWGTPGNGRIDGAVRLPEGGPNFSPYSAFGVALGRTYVHPDVRDIVAAAYAGLARSHPGVHFVYGETGLRKGGPFPPHRTHETGTSVDFMVPVRGVGGAPAGLPSSAANRFGYDLEFSPDGRLGALVIDFSAIAAHLVQLELHARARGLAITRVIFDPALTQRLLATPEGKALAPLPFMKGKPWIRHDEHYHVDFSVRCRPLNQRPL